MAWIHLNWICRCSTFSLYNQLPSPCWTRASHSMISPCFRMFKVMYSVGFPPQETFWMLNQNFSSGLTFFHILCPLNGLGKKEWSQDLSWIYVNIGFLLVKCINFPVDRFLPELRIFSAPYFNRYPSGFSWKSAKCTTFSNALCWGVFLLFWTSSLSSCQVSLFWLTIMGRFFPAGRTQSHPMCFCLM